MGKRGRAWSIVAERGRSMLPARLRGDVRWAAIGGVLGALGTSIVTYLLLQFG